MLDAKGHGGDAEATRFGFWDAKLCEPVMSSVSSNGSTSHFQVESFLPYMREVSKCVQ
mgnify:CR=1 FL=1